MRSDLKIRRSANARLRSDLKIRRSVSQVLQGFIIGLFHHIDLYNVPFTLLPFISLIKSSVVLGVTKFYYISGIVGLKDFKKEMNRDKKPLFRKVNTRARGVRHDFGGDFKHLRNKKRETPEQIKGSMHGKKERGLDYTPLFKFLLSKIGNDWNTVYSEARSRLDKPDPIYWIVALKEDERRDFVRVGESSYFSGMYVDDDGKLQLTAPDLQAKDMDPFCDCCTHTLNGKLFGTE